MYSFYALHALTPDEATIRRIANSVQNGAVIAYPTDTGMALGCALRNKEGIDRIRALREIPRKQSMTFLCDSLAHIADYAVVSDKAFRMMKKLTPGPFTFILPATKNVPVFAHDPKRKSVGIRIPRSHIARALLHALDEPLISISAKSREGGEYSSWEECVEDMQSRVDACVGIDDVSDPAHSLGSEASTIVDMSGRDFLIVRYGAQSDDVEALL